MKMHWGTEPITGYSFYRHITEKLNMGKVKLIAA